MLLFSSVVSSSQFADAHPVPLFYHFSLMFIPGFVYIDVFLYFRKPLSGLSGGDGKFIRYCNLIDDVCDDRRKHSYGSSFKIVKFLFSFVIRSLSPDE